MQLFVNWCLLSVSAYCFYVNNLEYFEKILFHNEFKDIIDLEYKAADIIDNISLDIAIKNANFLISNGYPNEAFGYIEYAENFIIKRKQLLNELDIINILKYYYCLNIRKYDMAVITTKK